MGGVTTKKQPQQARLPPPWPPPPPPSTGTDAEGKKKATYTAAASGGQWKVVEKKNRTPKVPVTKVWKPEQRFFEFPRDKTRPTNVGRATTSEDLRSEEHTSELQSRP